MKIALPPAGRHPPNFSSTRVFSRAFSLWASLVSSADQWPFRLPGMLGFPGGCRRASSAANADRAQHVEDRIPDHQREDAFVSVERLRVPSSAVSSLSPFLRASDGTDMAPSTGVQSPSTIGLAAAPLRPTRRRESPTPWENRAPPSEGERWPLVPPSTRYAVEREMRRRGIASIASIAAMFDGRRTGASASPGRPRPARWATTVDAADRLPSASLARPRPRAREYHTCAAVARQLERPPEARSASVHCQL
jgi:hypothetical protein